MTNKNTTADRQTQEKPAAQATEFNIQKIYVKDMSFESPNAPESFQLNWKPDVNLELNTVSGQINDTIYEVVLNITTTVKIEDKVAFLVEIKHAGIFTIKGLEGEPLKRTLGSFCPNIIFPYAREAISDLVIRGGFPQLNLAPINFDMVYEQFKEQQQANNQDQAAAAN